jgi:hypothetical protein
MLSKQPEPPQDALHAKYVTRRINHQETCSLNGACTNQAESFLARIRRMVMGQHHHVGPQYLYQYANEAAWKEDHRRLSNGELSYRKLALALAHPVRARIEPQSLKKTLPAGLRTKEDSSSWCKL